MRRTIEQALLIGRVASAIAQDSPALQLAFSLPSAWPQPAPGAVASRTRRRAADSAAREREAAAVAPFAAAVDGALARWAVWAARGLADTHAAALRSEHYLTVRSAAAVALLNGALPGRAAGQITLQGVSDGCCYLRQEQQLYPGRACR